MAGNIYSTQEYVFAYLSRYDSIPLLSNKLSQFLNGDRAPAFVSALYSAYINKGALLTLAGHGHNYLLKISKKMLADGEFVAEIKKNKFYDNVSIIDIMPDEWEILISVTFIFMDPALQKREVHEIGPKKPTKSFSFGYIGKSKTEKMDGVTREELGLEQSTQMTNVTLLSNRVVRLADEILALHAGRMQLEEEIKSLNGIINNMKNRMGEMDRKLKQMLAGVSSQ